MVKMSHVARIEMDNDIVLEHQVDILAEIVLTVLGVPGHHPRRVTDAGDGHGFSCGGSKRRNAEKT